jgi:hypothetical protein
MDAYVLNITVSAGQSAADRVAWVIENGVLAMSSGKLIAVGPASSVKIPQDAEVMT